MQSRKGEINLRTDFGKFAKKLRIEEYETLGDMAKKLGITASYLSAVENGKRKLPVEWREIIISKYKLNESQRLELLETTTLETLTKREFEAAKAVLTVLYLDDSSDYINGLWEVLRAILGHEVVGHDSFSVDDWFKHLTNKQYEETEQEEKE